MQTAFPPRTTTGPPPRPAPSADTRRPARRGPDGQARRREPGWFPRSPSNRSSGEVARLCPCGIATATPQAFTVASLASDLKPAREFPARMRGGRAPPSSPYPPDLSWRVLLRGVTALVPLVHLPVLLAGPAPSGSTGTSRRCRGCSPPSRRLPDQAAPSFTTLLRQRGGGGLSPPLGHMAPRGAPVPSSARARPGPRPRQHARYHYDVLDPARVFRRRREWRLRPAGAQAGGPAAAQLTAALNGQRPGRSSRGSPASSDRLRLIRNRAEICARRPPGLQPPGDLRGEPRARELGDLRAMGPLTGTLMCPPRPVPRAAAVTSHLPRHRRGSPGPAGRRSPHTPSRACRPRLISSRSDKVSRPVPAPRTILRCGRRGDPRALRSGPATPAADLRPDPAATTSPWPSAAAPAAAAPQSMSHHPHSPRPDQRKIVELAESVGTVERAEIGLT